MAFDAHANFATSLVATAPSPASSGTSLVVTAGQGTRFPAVSFNAVVGPANTLLTPANAEIVRVTLISTDTFTITRTQEGSSARSIVVGDQIYCGPTAKTFTDLEVVDAAAGTGSLRTVGKTALKAADGADTELAFSMWRPADLLRIAQGTSSQAQLTNQCFYYGGLVASGAANSGVAVFYLDPQDWGSTSPTSAVAGTRTIKIRFRATAQPNAVAPALTYTFGLYPVASHGGASNVQPTITVGTAVVTATIVNPSASALAHVEAAATTFPNAGDYVLAVSTSGAAPANCIVELMVQLQVQQV